jgi:hypothetical protein
MTNDERRSLLHTHPFHPHRASLWLGAILGSLVLLLAPATAAVADEPGVEGSPSTAECHGHISAGTPELGSSEQQVQYTFFCNGPITGYSLETNVQVTGFQAAPLVTDAKAEPLSDTFSCGGELPGWADNCVGATKRGFETITGQFAIDARLCAEPRVDPLLTVTDIYLEKGVPTQAISGPFDLGRPHRCPASKAYAGGTRLDPAEPKPKAKANQRKKDKRKAKAGKTKKK